MPKSGNDKPKYLMCARALALLSGLAAGAAGCGQSLVPQSGPKDAAGQTYDGGSLGSALAYDGAVMGVRINPDAHPTPYDGGVVGVRAIDAHPTPYDGGVVGVRPIPYDGGAVGLRLNPDANVGSDAQTSPYDGGFLGVVNIKPHTL